MYFVHRKPNVPLAFVILATGAISVAHGGEIRLRHECQVSGSLVLLGDVAEVLASDPRQAKELANIELFPTPQAGQKRFVRAREIQDALQLRGVNLAEHRISGASQVEIVLATEPAAPAAPLAVSSTALRQAKRAVRDAIIDYLRRTASDSDPWDVEFEFSEDQVRQVAGAEKDLVVAGGASPWVGAQQFIVSAPAKSQPVKLRIEARVTLPPQTVIATRSLPRGAIIHISDLKLDRGRQGDADADDAFTRLEDVVGKEVARTLAGGQPIRRDAVRAPLVVRKGEVVTVYARQSGLVVRTTARSRDDGSVGEVITVESLLNRQTFFARASGVQQVEVFAHAIDASTTGRETNMPTTSERVAPEKAVPERVVQKERSGQ
jgi:flagella basal body P-ring formation protein FlgA